MDSTELIQAIQTLNTEDAFRARLDAQQWRTFCQYLTRHELRSGDLLQVFVTGGAPGGSRIAILRPGAICGEPGLFSDAPRMANVEAMTPCVVYALRLPRFEELVARVPAVAVEVGACGRGRDGRAHARQRDAPGAVGLREHSR